MKTPAGKECRFYYEDFHRGRDDQACRLVQARPDEKDWKPKICSSCPVPNILAANGDPNLVLEGKIAGGILGFGKKMEVKAFCSKHLVDVANPSAGCSQCAKEKPGLEELFKGL